MSYESEKRTRNERIDPELAWAGWKVTGYDARKSVTAYENCAVKEFPTVNGPADYALIVGGRVLGVVEAKKVSLAPILGYDPKQSGGGERRQCGRNESAAREAKIPAKKLRKLVKLIREEFLHDPMMASRAPSLLGCTRRSYPVRWRLTSLTVLTKTLVPTALLVFPRESPSSSQSNPN